MTLFCGFMGIRHADVKLLSLHPVATATVANISRNWVSHLERLPFSVLSLRTQLLKNIILSVQYDYVWEKMSLMK